MTHPEFNMDNQWLPFTPNRHFRKDPRVFVAADGHVLHHARRPEGDRRHLEPLVRRRGPQPPPINEAIKRQLDTLDYATAFQVSNDQAFKSPPSASPRWLPATSTRCSSATRARRRRTPR
jgi:beta-alanine--pyruvate transaminase